MGFVDTGTGNCYIGSDIAGDLGWNASNSGGFTFTGRTASEGFTAVKGAANSISIYGGASVVDGPETPGTELTLSHFYSMNYFSSNDDGSPAGTQASLVAGGFWQAQELTGSEITTFHGALDTLMSTLGRI